MGFMTRFFGKEAIQSSGASNKVLAATDPGAINPDNPGNFSSIRTAPVVRDPRYFSRAEADSLKQLATEKSEGARQTERAYKHLKKIEKADATVHRAHRRYESAVGDHELTKIRANAKHARHMQALRPEYARLEGGLQRAEFRAQTRINELKAMMGGQAK